MGARAQTKDVVEAVLTPTPEAPDGGAPGYLLRFGIGLAVTSGATALVAWRPVRQLEILIFRKVNELPDEVYWPLYGVMQMGSYGGVLAGASLAAAARRPRLARDILVVGSMAYGIAKVMKETINRKRPLSLLVEIMKEIRVRGQPASGLGYPSGHAATSAAIATAAAPHLPPAGRAALSAGTALTGLSRIYVGAHMPDDVIGGWALGWMLGSGWHFLDGLISRTERNTE